MRIVVIGLGGVGSIVVEKIARYINYSRNISCEIMLVDGDTYEPKNYERQEFLHIGNKANVKANELEVKFTNIKFDVSDQYINSNNISNVIKDEDIILICVDNHATRNVINSYCKTLKNVTIISGGNEMTDGNVQLYKREGGVDLTPDLGAYHPEIENPEDKLPDEMSCEELSVSEPQLFFTNLGVAFFMCCMFYNAVIKNNLQKSESYFDIVSMTADSKTRLVRSTRK